MSFWVSVQFLLCPVVLISLLYRTAPYGRHHARGWGPSVPNRLAWFAMELPALLLPALILFGAFDTRQAVSWLPWLMWSVHYAYRTFIFPALMRPSGRSFPLLLVVFAVTFNILNGYNNAEALMHNEESGARLLTVHFALGSLLFILGFSIHVHCDAIIRNLRANGETGYRIPQGFWFRRSGSPQYLGEMIQWLGWAILTWSWAGLAFALFTVCNLAPRAISNHRWYQKTFENYPKERKALIPGVF